MEEINVPEDKFAYFKEEGLFPLIRESIPGRAFLSTFGLLTGGMIVTCLAIWCFMILSLDMPINISLLIKEMPNWFWYTGIVIMSLMLLFFLTDIILSTINLWRINKGKFVLNIS